MKRTLYYEILPHINHKNARIICGMRQVGKTSLMRMLYVLNLIAKVTEGQLFETAVCNQLEHYGRLTFYNKRNTAEIDFILNDEIAFEVKLKATQGDLDKIKKLAGVVQVNNYYAISKKFVDTDKVIFPQFL